MLCVTTDFESNYEVLHCLPRNYVPFLLDRCHVKDISAAVVASMEIATLPTSTELPLDYYSLQSSNNREVVDWNKTGDHAADPALKAANITCVVDDDPAPRSQVSFVTAFQTSRIHNVVLRCQG